jgi:phytoene dehydrogenase-like protein
MDHGAIVIGAGHNGLITAAYLAKAGLDTLLIEARESVGGCASTESDLGARFNICNCDHMVFRSTPVMDELRLEDHGLQYLDTTPAQLHASYDGSPAWGIFHEVDRTLDMLRLTHPKQVSNYQRYVDTALPLAKLVLNIATDVPTAGNVLPKVARALPGSAKAIATLLKWSKMSVADVLRGFFDDDAVSSPLITTGPAVWGVNPYWKGTGMAAMGFALKHATRGGRPVGGSGALTQAIHSVYETAGGKTLTGAYVSEIVCQGEKVIGVRLRDGRMIESDTVVVAIDPRVAFVDFLKNAPSGANEMVQRYRDMEIHEGYESKIDAVVSNLPSYPSVDMSAFEKVGVLDPLIPTMIISPSIDAVAKAHDLMAEGRIADQPMFFANIPSVLDPTMKSSDGNHVFSLEALFTPYGLKGGWENSTEPQRWLEVYDKFVGGGFLEGVQRYRAMTPARYESDFSMNRGYATSFAGTPISALRGKPRELTRYETPVKGLFLTGAATFPGAGVWGNSGRNAANVILAKG